MNYIIYSIIYELYNVVTTFIAAVKIDERSIYR